MDHSQQMLTMPESVHAYNYEAGKSGPDQPGKMAKTVSQMAREQGKQ